MELVSILCSIKDITKIWKRTEESILTQTYRPLEFILILDGMGYIPKEIEELKEKTKKEGIAFRLLINKGRLGLTKSLNKGLFSAKGEFIARVDANTWFVEGRIKQQVRFIKNKRFDLISSYCWVVDEASKIYKIIVSPIEENKLYRTLENNNCLAHPTIMFRKDSIKKAGLYNEEFVYAQDYELYLRLISRKYKIGVLPEPLVYKFFSPDSNTIVNRKKQLLFVLKAQKEYFKFTKKKELLGAKSILPTLVRIYLPNYLRRCIHFLQRRFSKYEILIFGIKGLPGVGGGAEIHCEKLMSLISKKGLKIVIYRREYYKFGFLKDPTISFINLPHIQYPGVETFSHSLLCFLDILIRKPRGIIHIHNIGSGLFVFLFKILGRKIIFTCHSFNYLHRKWGRFAKVFLRLGEFLALKFANRVIVVSKAQQEYLERKYHRKDIIWIPNGAPEVQYMDKLERKSILAKYGLSEKEFILYVGRITQEKGIDLLVKAYCKAKIRNSVLVICGSPEYKRSYMDYVRGIVGNRKDVIFTGYITQRELTVFYSNAKLLVIPSYHECMPLVFLEAMSYGLPVLVSDIAAFREFPLKEKRYFAVGDIDSLTERIKILFVEGMDEEEKKLYREVLRDNYRWDKAADRIFEVYKSLMM